MLEKIFLVILLFTVLFVAFNPQYIDPSQNLDFPSFSDIFSFGYEITIGSVEVVVSTFKERLGQWQDNVIGFRLKDYINSFIMDMPVINTLVTFVKKCLNPLENIYVKIAEWLIDKLG